MCSYQYVSPERYKRMNPNLGIGVETIKKMIRSGKLEGYIDDDPDTKFVHYYVLVNDNKSRYSEEYVKELESKIAKYEEKIKSINTLSTI